MVFRLGVNNWGLNNYIYSSLNKTNKRIVTQLAINCFILSIDKEEFSNCSYLINEIKGLLENELNFYEQTVFLYATGYYEFKRQLSSGIETMKQAIQVLDILGEDKLKLHYTSHFDKLVNNK
ncbi:transcriptional regulator [Streptococcus pneumoniae]|nr:transcriptional regulator [Streptococcus pneumoniae]